MSSQEIHGSEGIDAYKNSIMERYNLALTRPGGANCHDAAYYLLGVEPEEYGSDGVCYVDYSIFDPTDDIYQADLVAFGRFYVDELSCVHLAALHPLDKTKVIHRDLEGYYQTRRSNHNFFTELVDIFDQLSSKGGSPCRIENLDQVKKRWCDSDYFQMYLFKFRPEYFDKLLQTF